MRKIVSLSKLSLLVIISSYSLTSFCSILVVTAAPYIKEGLQISSTMSSILISAYPLGICLGQLFFGAIVDRQGVHRVYLFGAILLFFASILSFYGSDNISFLIPFYFIQSLGVAAVILAARVLLCRAAQGDNSKLGRFYSLEYFSSVASGAVSPLIAVAMISLFSWNSIFLYTAFFALFFAVTFRSTVYSLPGFSSLVPIKHLTSYRNLLSNGKFINYTLVGFMTYVWMYTYFVGVPHMLKFVFEVSTLTYGLLMTTFLIISLSAALLNMILLSYISIKALLLYSILGTFTIVAVMIAVLLLDTAVFYFFVLLIALMSFTVTVAMTEAMTLALNSCQANETGRATALFGFCVYAGGFATSIFTGYLLDLPYDDLLSLLLWLAGTSIVTLFLCFLAVKEPKKPKVKSTS